MWVQGYPGEPEQRKGLSRCRSSPSSSTPIFSTLFTRLIILPKGAFLHPLLVNLHRNSIFRSMYTYSGLTGHHSRTQSIPGPDMQLINSSITPSNDVFFVPPSDKPWSFQIFNSKTDSGGPFSQIFLLRRLQYWQDGAVSGINYPATFVEWIPQARRRSFALLLLSSVLIFGIRTSSL